jgi:hypothetical protein
MNPPYAQVVHPGYYYPQEPTAVSQSRKGSLRVQIPGSEDAVPSQFVQNLPSPSTFYPDFYHTNELPSPLTFTPTTFNSQFHWPTTVVKNVANAEYKPSPLAKK